MFSKNVLRVVVYHALSFQVVAIEFVHVACIVSLFVCFIIFLQSSLCFIHELRSSRELRHSL